MATRVVFFGSPDFALPSLEAVLKQFDVVGVVTQPDRPAGRGQVLTPPPAKILAKKYGIQTLQPNRLKDPGVVDQLLEWNADVYVVAAFGQIFRKNILDLPKFGLINVHGSLLPRWRGASPVQAAILAGDQKTGITIMKLNEGIDTGDVLSMREIEILPHETAGDLSQRLAKLGADLLGETLPGYLEGKIPCVPQSEEGATYAGMIQKSDAILDVSESAAELCLKIRAYNPWPVARIKLANKDILVHQAHVINTNLQVPGEPVIYQNQPAINTADGLLVMDLLQVPGKKTMDGKAFIFGNQNWGKRI